MFRFTRKPSSGSHSQYLATITCLVQSGYVKLIQVTICSHNTDNILYELYVSTLNQACNFS